MFLDMISKIAAKNKIKGDYPSDPAEVERKQAAAKAQAKRKPGRKKKSSGSDIDTDLFLAQHGYDINGEKIG